jgi:glycosyltransferase involved in cell wall biosynthesis
MRVLFINENQLGHSSYLLPFVRTFEAHPELGIEPALINATPLSPKHSWWGDASIRGLRRWGLDLHTTRWRLAASRNVYDQMGALLAQNKVDAIVVNTQSVALSLDSIAQTIPTFVCLDATFEQLLRSPWFAPNRGAAAVAPAATMPIRYYERKVLRAAAKLLPWSTPVRDSLFSDYAISQTHVYPLPPSISPFETAQRTKPASKKRLLFVGGDFRRKGGALVLEAFRTCLRATCELHIVTESPIPEEENVFIHRGVKAYSENWFQLWQSADVFVFPSRLETFGIVLLEALAFGVPVISSPTGAAADILLDGKAGWLLPEHTAGAVAQLIQEVLDSPRESERRSSAGRQHVRQTFDLETNTRKLAKWLAEYQ